MYDWYILDISIKIYLLNYDSNFPIKFVCLKKIASSNERIFMQ